MDAGEVGRLLWLVVAVWIALIIIRFVFPQLSVLVIRLLDHRPSQRARRMSYKVRVVGAVAGFRGAVSLAIPLSVPTVLDNGDPFPGREDIVFVTAGVILLTLLVQGPMLPVVLRWANLPDDHTAEAELRLAEHEITTAALAALPELADEHGISEEVRERLARDYQEHLALVQARNAQSQPQTDRQAETLDAMLLDTPEAREDQASRRRVDLAKRGPLNRNEQYTRLRLAMLDRKREVLLRLRRNGTIDDTIARHIQTRLDIEELRLTGVEPLE